MNIFPKISKFIWRNISKLIQKGRIFYFRQISANSMIVGKPKIIQPLLILGNNRVQFNSNVSIGYFPSPFYFNGYSHFETRGNKSSIEIGSDTYLNNNTSLIADSARIIIGNKVLAGTQLVIYTSDFHALSPELRHNPSAYQSKDVVIEDNVFIGSNVTILKGVSIGKNSVIATGSVVTSNIPMNVIAGGIPCKVIKPL